MFYKNDVLRNFAKFTGKHLRQSLFFNKVAGLRPEACYFIKKETLTQVFSNEFCEISMNTFFTEHLRWLLLFIKKVADLQSHQFFFRKKSSSEWSLCVFFWNNAGNTLNHRELLIQNRRLGPWKIILQQYPQNTKGVLD